MIRAKKKINKGMVAFKCIVMAFVWTAVFYGGGYGVVLGIKYLVENFTMEQVGPWFLLVVVFVLCAAEQIDNYDREVHPEKYKDNTDED